ncbi:MAG: hypothetical protein ACODAC_07290 [Pseudomonadota bacterium]
MRDKIDTGSGEEAETEDTVDYSVARNYEEGAVWITTPSDGRRLVSPEEARRIADDWEEYFDLDAHEEMGYETKAFVEELRQAADEVE